MAEGLKGLASIGNDTKGADGQRRGERRGTRRGEGTEGTGEGETEEGRNKMSRDEEGHLFSVE